jgi:hypothetical protein
MVGARRAVYAPRAESRRRARTTRILARHVGERLLRRGRLPTSRPADSTSNPSSALDYFCLRPSVFRMVCVFGSGQVGFPDLAMENVMLRTNWSMAILVLCLQILAVTDAVAQQSPSYDSETHGSFHHPSSAQNVPHRLYQSGSECGPDQAELFGERGINYWGTTAKILRQTVAKTN